MTFFKTLNDDNTDTDDTADPYLTNVDIDHGINEEISTNEIKKSVRIGQYHE